MSRRSHVHFGCVDSLLQEDRGRNIEEFGQHYAVTNFGGAWVFRRWLGRWFALHDVWRACRLGVSTIVVDSHVDCRLYQVRAERRRARLGRSDIGLRIQQQADLEHALRFLRRWTFGTMNIVVRLRTNEGRKLFENRHSASVPAQKLVRAVNRYRRLVTST